MCRKEIAKELPNVCQHWHIESGNDNEVKNRKKLYLGDFDFHSCQAVGLSKRQ